MAGKIEARLKEMGTVLPSASTPVANYVPFVKAGGLLFIAGQLPMDNGTLLHPGIVGNVTVDNAVAAARQCALNIIAQAKAACDGDLDQVRRIVQLNAFVATPNTFFDHAKIANGASDLMVAVFGDAGRHARVATGCPSLPRNAAVEISAIIDIG